MIAKRVSDMVLSAVLVFVAVALWLVADAFPSFARSQSVEADFWPKVILTAIAVLGCLLWLQSFLEYRALRAAGPPAGGPAEEPGLNYGKLLATGGLILLYFLSLEWIGFFFATLAFLYIAENIPSYRNWKVKAVFPIVFTFFILYFFTKVLSLPLTRGTGIFYEMSRLLY